MKSEEIKNLLELRNGVINLEEYKRILSTSPQIRNIKHNPNTDKFEIDTDDDYHFEYKVFTKQRRNEKI